jgi:tRNA(fMet)-specific endonuclease VapC
VTALRYLDDPRCATLTSRLRAAADPGIAITVISLEEQLRGWLAEINRWKQVHRQITAYDRLLNLIAFLKSWEIVQLTEPAAGQFERLRRQKVRIGSQDLKIASIALVNDALLLSANLRDFRQVPGLRVENWLE